jgi:AraC-like DNA-binding protein
LSEYLVRASALQGYAQTVQQLGGDHAALLASVGLAAGDTDPEAWISYRAYLRLLEESSRVLDCPDFGLRLSDHQDLNILGAVGYFIAQAPDVRTALQELGQYFAQHNQGAVVATRVDQGSMSWSFTTRPQQNAPITQQSDLAAGIAVKVMRFLHTGWKPSAIYLPHGAPADTRAYRARFDCPIHFDWDTTTIASDAAMLDAPLAHADPRLHQVLEHHLRELDQTYSDDFPAKVAFLIKQALLSGDCSVERVAGSLAINKRTLQRKLKALGTSFKDLLDDVRFEIACNYLRESSGPLTLLAHMLCYSELSAFSNAFKHRYGLSPRDWKKRHG